MSIGSNENQPSSIIQRIDALRQQKIQSGELRDTSFATFLFPYLSDPRYLNADPQVKSAIDQFNLPEITVIETEKAVKDLKIKKKVTVKTIIPDSTEMRHIIPSLGIGGRAVSSEEIRLYCDLNHPNIVDSLNRWRKRQIAHEVNHIARFQVGKGGLTLLDALISEGLATRYEELWSNVYQQTPWGHALEEKELISAWTQAQTELYSNRYHHNEWFFGYNGKYKKWTGYSLGTAIVEKFVSKYPKIPMSWLVRMPSRIILTLSGFK